MEAGLQRRLAVYRTLNTEDETVLNYFDELEFHPRKNRYGILCQK